MRLVLVLALLSATSFVHAQATRETAATPERTPAEAAPPPSAPGAASADPDEKICKVAREIGSNRLKRICRTRAQIDADREAAREALSREQKG